MEIFGGGKKSKDIYDITKLWNVFLCVFWSFSLWEVALSGIVLLVMGLRWGFIRQIDGGAERLEAGRGLSVYVGGIIISCLYTIRALMTLTWIFIEVAYSDIGVREGGTIGYSSPDRLIFSQLSITSTWNWHCKCYADFSTTKSI